MWKRGTLDDRSCRSPAVGLRCLVIKVYWAPQARPRPLGPLPPLGTGPIGACSPITAALAPPPVSLLAPWAPAIACNRPQSSSHGFLRRVTLTETRSAEPASCHLRPSPTLLLHGRAPSSPPRASHLSPPTITPLALSVSARPRLHLRIPMSKEKTRKQG